MKKKILMIMAMLAVLGIFSIVITEIGNKNNKKGSVATDSSAEKNNLVEYYTYSQVEDVVAYLANSQEEEKSLGRLIDPLNKSGYITVEYVKNVVNTIGISTDVYSEVIENMQGTDYVSIEQFETIYKNIVETGRINSLYRKSIFVYDVEYSLDENGIGQSQVFDGKQRYLLSVEVPDEYHNKIIDVYLKEGKIFKINGLSEGTVVFSGVWIVSSDGDSCTFIHNGTEKNFSISELSSDTDALPDITTQTVAEVTLDNTGVISIREYQDIISSRVLEVSENKIQVENRGSIPYSEDIKIYDVSTNDIPSYENSAYILKGYGEVKLVLDDNKIIAAVIEDEIVARNIRVILSNNSFSSYKMPEITFTCDTSFKIKYPDDGESLRGADKTVTIRYEDYESGDVITIVPDEEDGNIQILSLERSYGNPIYQGTIELRIFDDGLHIINELPLETYLYSVVSSEMLANSENEALKAMAICTRGYAYIKMEDGSFEDYHAHLDDSTLCQMYNNVQATEASIKAVKDTYGIVPVYEDAVIVPLYFSTSAGTLCTNQDIWGGLAYPYFRANLDTIEKDVVDLSEEETFIQFMQDSLGYDIIDKDMPYYRWSISFTGEDITEAVNSMLEERLSVSSENIKEKDSDGNLHSTEITDIGQIKSIEVVERSTSGMVNVLEIEGTLATIQVSGQTNVRNIITPVNQEIVRQDGNVVTGWTSLPSPYYYIEASEDGYIIYGGGFGHGVGMSQSGAEILAEQGYNYKYILRHYYSYIDFSSIYIIESKKDEE